MPDPAFPIQTKPRNSVLIVGVLVAFSIPLGLNILAGQSGATYFDKLFYSRFIYWGTVLILFLYARLVESQPLLIVAESGTSISSFLLSVLVLYFLSIAAAIVSAIPIFFGWHESDLMIRKIVLLLRGHNAMIFFIALTAGVTEEIIMRGYILTRLLQLFKKPLLPVLISSLIFAALHYKYGSLRELIFTFLIGLIFSIYYLQYRNIKAIIAAHFLIDFINLIIAEHMKLK